MISTTSLAQKLTLIAGLLPATALAQSEFIPLGELPGGSSFSSASAVSSFDAADGLVENLVVAGNSQSALGREAFRWTQPAGIAGLGDLGGPFFFSSAASVSDDGTIIVGAAAADEGILAYRWQSGTGMVSLGDLPGGPEQSEASAISGDGQTIVGASRSIVGPFGDEAFLWTSSLGLTGIGRLGGEGLSVASSVNTDGTIVVGSAGPDAQSTDAFRWTEAGGMVALERFPSQTLASSALGISADGSTIVGWTSLLGQNQLAVRWTGAGIESLGDPAPFEESDLFAQAASEDGSVVVGYGQDGATLRPFLWTQGDGMRPLDDVFTDDFGLDLTGWTLTLALDVTVHTASGRTAIVGVGTNPGGQTEAFLAVLDPAPPCRVDLDGDGELTIFDFLIFQTLFDAGDLTADFDGDGVLTIFDFLRYIDEFDDGCP